MDLIENKLSCMTISDRDDLREKVTLQRALNELATFTGMASLADVQADFAVPRRGRRRRLGGEGSYA